MNNVIKRVWNQNKMVAIEDLKGMTFQNESGGHTFQISGVDDAGNTVALSGSVAGVFLRPDNTDVTITGSASGGLVSVTLLPEYYDVPGRFGLTVFVTDNGQKTAVYAAVGTVSRTSSGTVSPGTSADAVDLINRINAAVATIPASWTGLMADIAPTYSENSLYAVGAYAYYNGDLYMCISPITTKETWTPAHWTTANLGTDLRDLKSAFDNTQKSLSDITEPAIRNMISVMDFVNNSGVATNRSESEGLIKVTSNTTGAYNTTQTDPSFITDNFVVGKLYILRFRVTAVTDNPQIVVGIRGTAANVNTLTESIAVSNDDRSLKTLLFSPTEYTKRISLFVSYGSSTNGASATFGDISISEYYGSAIDVTARDEIDITKAFLDSDSLISPVPFPWESGIFTPTTGRDYALNTYIRNDYMMGLPFEYRIEAPDGYLLRLFGYDLNGDYAGTLNKDGTLKKVANNNYAFVKSFDFANFPGYKFKVGMCNESISSDIQISAGNNVKLYYRPRFNMKLPSFLFGKNRPFFQAHQGEKTVAPANTPIAYELACKDGWDGVVIAGPQMSADGVWYIMHDLDVSHTTDGTGNLNQLNSEYLDTLKIIVGTNVDQYTDEQRRIPKLKDVLKMCKRYGVYPVLRIGALPSTIGSQADYDKWQSFLDIVTQYDTSKMIFSESNANRLTLLRKFLGDVPVQWYLSSYANIPDIVKLLMSYETNYINAGLSILGEAVQFTDAAIKAIHNAGILAVAWTDTDDEDDILSLIDRGIDVIQNQSFTYDRIKEFF